MCIDNLTLVIGNLKIDYKNKANSKWLKIIKKITPVFLGVIVLMLFDYIETSINKVC